MRKLRATRALDAGILVLVVIAARAAIAQEPTRPRATPIAPPATRAPDDPRPFLEPRPSGPPSVPMTPPTPQADGRISVQLKDGSRLVGKPMGLESFKFKASFGEIAVPLDSLLGIKVTETANSSGGVASTATILFKNGDVLTAEPILATLKLDTVLGDTAIAGKHVESLVMTTDKMTWVNDGKWRLVPEGAGVYGPPGAPGFAPSPYAPGAYDSSPFAPSAVPSPVPFGGPPIVTGPPVALPALVPAPVRPVPVAPVRPR